MTHSFDRFGRTLFGSAAFTFAVALHALAGCSGGGSDEGGASSSSSSGGQSSGSSGSSGSSSPSGPKTPQGSEGSSGANNPGNNDQPSESSNAPTCEVGDDCPNWFCECAEGPPVNTRSCTNGRCQDAATACPKSCKSFGTCWTGQAGGGWEGGTNTGPSDC